jgi:hypothetical protein
VCRGCGAYTQPRNGKGDAYAYCKRCHLGAIERRWTRERVLDAMRAWRELHGRLPTSYDWSRTHARAPWRRGPDTLDRRAMAVGERRRDAVRKLARSPLGGVFEAERGPRLKFTGFCEFLSSHLGSGRHDAD